MRFSAVLLSLALSVGLAAAGPVASDPSISVVKDAKPGPYTPGESGPHPAVAGGQDVEVVGPSGVTKGVSKREDYNPLDERAPVLFIVCTGSRCNGRCYSTNLGALAFNRCYSAPAYNSFWIKSRTGLNYGVYVGSGCRGVFIFFSFPVDTPSPIAPRLNII